MKKIHTEVEEAEDFLVEEEEEEIVAEVIEVEAIEEAIKNDFNIMMIRSKSIRHIRRMIDTRVAINKATTRNEESTEVTIEENTEEVEVAVINTEDRSLKIH